MPRIIITEPDTAPQPYRLEIDRIVTKIGRAQDNDVILSDGSSSSYHCKIKRVEGGFILADSDSTNGIKFKGTRYTVIDLKDGQIVQIGDHIDLEFTLTEEEIAQLSTEDFESHEKTSFPSTSKTKDHPKSEEPEAIDSDKSSKSKKRKKNHDDSENKSKRKKASNKSKSSSKSQQVQSRNNKSQGPNMGLSFIIFMILAVLCFLAGLAIRHYQDHSSFIFG